MFDFLFCFPELTRFTSKMSDATGKSQLVICPTAGCNNFDKASVTSSANNIFAAEDTDKYVSDYLECFLIITQACRLFNDVLGIEQFLQGIIYSPTWHRG